MSDIKVISEPTVYLVGKQVVVEEELSRFLADHDFCEWETDAPSPAAKLVEVAARNCYQSYRGGRRHHEHVTNLKKVAHGSCLEHAVWNFLIVGVSRSLLAEFTRHRTFSPSVLSQRYVDESAAEYVVPADLKLEVDCFRYREAITAKPGMDPVATAEEANLRWPEVNSFADKDLWSYHEAADAGKMWLDSVSQSHEAYVGLTSYLAKKVAGKGITGTEGRKKARQAARSVLPNATETKIFVTANARALRNFVELRASRHAEDEIRVLANKMYAILAEESPSLWDDYESAPLEVGYELTTPYRKI